MSVLQFLAWPPCPRWKNKNKTKFLLSSVTDNSCQHVSFSCKVFFNATQLSWLNYPSSSQSSAHTPLKEGSHKSSSTFQPGEVALYRPHWFFLNVHKRGMGASLAVPLIMCNHLISENCHGKEVWKANEWTFILLEAKGFSRHLVAQELEPKQRKQVFNCS